MISRAGTTVTPQGCHALCKSSDGCWGRIEKLGCISEAGHGFWELESWGLGLPALSPAAATDLPPSSAHETGLGHSVASTNTNHCGQSAEHINMGLDVFLNTEAVPKHTHSAHLSLVL